MGDSGHRTNGKFGTNVKFEIFGTFGILGTFWNYKHLKGIYFIYQTSSVGLMLDQSLRCWPIIETLLVKCILTIKFKQCSKGHVSESATTVDLYQRPSRLQHKAPMICLSLIHMMSPTCALSSRHWSSATYSIHKIHIWSRITSGIF